MPRIAVDNRFLVGHLFAPVLEDVVLWKSRFRLDMRDATPRRGRRFQVGRLYAQCWEKFDSESQIRLDLRDASPRSGQPLPVGRLIAKCWGMCAVRAGSGSTRKMPWTTPWEISRRTLLVLKNMVMKITAFLPTPVVPPVLCVETVGWTVFGRSEWFRVYARCAAGCGPFVVCFKMVRMYALYSKNGHALMSVTGDTVEDPLKDPSDQAHCDPRPCLWVRLHYAFQRTRPQVSGHGCDLAFCLQEGN